MGPIVLAAAAILVWAWWTGRLTAFTYEDVAAALIFLLGFEMLVKGKVLAGAMLMAGALLWAAWRRRPPGQKPMPVEDARALLGVGAGADAGEIKAAHRRLIARVHPDAGGSAELAHRVNLARDTLIAEMNRGTPRAS